MKKSELKKIILEALTPDEATKVNSKYKEIYSGMLKNKPLKLKKYDNPDAVAYGRAIKLVQKESAKIAEKKLTAAEKAKKEDIIMALKKEKGGKDKLKPSDYAYATSTAIDVAEEITSETDMEKIKDYKPIVGGDNSLPRKWAKMDPKEKKKLYPKFYNKKYTQLRSHEKAQIKETGENIAKNNMKRYKEGNMNENRITELVKAALMGPISEKKTDHNKDGKIDSKDYLIARDKAIKKAKGEKVDEDVVKGSNIKKVGDKWRVLSGKTGKMWKQKYDSEADAKAALRGYFANLSEVDKTDSKPAKTLRDVELVKQYLPKINTKAEWVDLANILLSLEGIPGMNNMLKKTFLLNFIKEKLGSK